MSFARRAITATITLGGGPNGDQKVGEYKLEGGRIECMIINHGQFSNAEMQCRIFGLPLSDIKKLTVIGTVLYSRIGKNEIQIDAGNEGEQLTTIFRGGIYTAYGNFQTAPDVSLDVIAITGGNHQVKAAPNYSTAGPLPISEVFKHLANEAGFGFVNEGVDGVLPIQYLTGSVLDQIKQASVAAQCNHTIDSTSNILYIWPKGSARKGYVPTVGPGNGLVGYPVFSSQYLNIRTEFLPNVVYGGHIKIADDSLGNMINGEWAVNQLTHNLASQVPNGPWFTDMMLYHPQS